MSYIVPLELPKSFDSEVQEQMDYKIARLSGRLSEIGGTNSCVMRLQSNARYISCHGVNAWSVKALS